MGTLLWIVQKYSKWFLDCIGYTEFGTILASNAIFRKIAYFGRNPFPVFLPKCLLVTYPQTPEIIAVGNGYAFRWNAEKQKWREPIVVTFPIPSLVN